MQTPELNYTTLRNLGIFLACSALIAGCAGNHLEPGKSAAGPTTISQVNEAKTNPQVASANPDPVSNQDQPAENQSVTPQASAMSGMSSSQSDNASAASKDSVAKSTTASIQEPAQRTFYFGLNQSKLNAQDKAVIAQHARFLKANPSLVLEINGYTDSTGPHGYNEYLSKLRAEAVASLLIQDGVKRSQLVIKALADKNPLADATDPGKNRRVDLQYDDMSMLSSK